MFTHDRRLSYYVGLWRHLVINVGHPAISKQRQSKMSFDVTEHLT